MKQTTHCFSWRDGFLNPLIGLFWVAGIRTDSSCDKSAAVLPDLRYFINACFCLFSFLFSPCKQNWPCRRNNSNCTVTATTTISRAPIDPSPSSSPPSRRCRWRPAPRAPHTRPFAGPTFLDWMAAVVVVGQRAARWPGIDRLPMRSRIRSAVPRNRSRRVARSRNWMTIPKEYSGIKILLRQDCIRISVQSPNLNSIPN